MQKNVSGQVIAAQLNATADGSAVTSGTTTVYVTGDGGTQSSGGGTVTHEGQGCWSYAPTQAETNYDHISFTFANSSAITQTVNVYTGVPQTGDSFARLGTPDGASVSADVAAIAESVLTTQMSESYASDGAAPTLSQALFGLYAINGLTKKAISSTTVTAFQLDETTAAITQTLDDANNPTTVTRTG